MSKIAHPLLEVIHRKAVESNLAHWEIMVRSERLLCEARRLLAETHGMVAPPG
ncbi:hypothetical protein [Sphingomonas parva]|uniref:hypothetical protein n=1 Tax=Sphingomonas parva TaxID=2555898 RepID=UPI001CDBC855|nr:hypothetical protein [Sphingomonas parva]